jgi:hypothetical protein
MFDVVVPIVLACSRKPSTFPHVASIFPVHRSTLAHDTSIEFAQFLTALLANVASLHARTSSRSDNRHPNMSVNAVATKPPNVATASFGGTHRANAAKYASDVNGADDGDGARVLARARAVIHAPRRAASLADSVVDNG